MRAGCRGYPPQSSDDQEPRCVRGRASSRQLASHFPRWAFCIQYPFQVDVCMCIHPGAMKSNSFVLTFSTWHLVQLALLPTHRICDAVRSDTMRSKRFINNQSIHTGIRLYAKQLRCLFLTNAQRSLGVPMAMVMCVSLDFAIRTFGLAHRFSGMPCAVVEFSAQLT